MVASDAEIQKVIGLFREAADASRQLATRRGCLIELDATAAEDVLVSTDLHGQRLHFQRILGIADWERHPRRHVVTQEVCHGGPNYPQGGCMSHLLLEDIARVKAENPERFHFLLGNHELAEIMDFPITKSHRMLNLQFRTGMQALYGEACEDVRDAMIAFLRSCPLAIRLSNGVFLSHSAPASVDEMGFDPALFGREVEDGDMRSGGDAFRLVWGRDFRQENADAFANLIDCNVMIHGHEPCADGVQVPNGRQIILDSCGPGGRYVLLPMDRPLTQADILDRVARVFDGTRIPSAEEDGS